MGDAIKPGGARFTNYSTAQKNIERMLGQAFQSSGLFGNIRGGIFGDPKTKDIMRDFRRTGRRTDRALRDILQGKAGRTDTRALETEALGRWDRDINPRIGAGFAKHGATLGSRRGETGARSLGELQQSLNAMNVGIREQSRNRQLQAAQTMTQGLSSRAAAFGALGDAALRRQSLPFQIGTSFLGLKPHDTAMTPSPLDLGMEGLQMGTSFGSAK